MVRNRRLIEVEPGRKIADADLVAGPCERRQNGYTRGIPERFEKRSFEREISIK